MTPEEWSYIFWDGKTAKWTTLRTQIFCLIDILNVKYPLYAHVEKFNRVLKKNESTKLFQGEQNPE